MMSADFQTQLEVIRTALDAVIHNSGYSHERRNQRLRALQKLIEQYIDSYKHGWQEDWLHKRIILRTVYELCIWTQDHETHNCVKDRLRLAVEVIECELNNMARMERSKLEARLNEARLNRNIDDAISKALDDDSSDESL